MPCRSGTLTVFESEHAEVPGTVRHTHIKGLHNDDDVGPNVNSIVYSGLGL